MLIIGGGLRGAPDQEVDQVIAQGVILRLAEQGLAAAVAGQSDLDEFHDTGIGPVAHQHDTIGQENGFVNIMRDHEHRLASRRDDAQQLVLDGAAGQGVERAKRLVEQQHLGLYRKCTGYAHTLLHPARKFRRLLVQGPPQPHHFKVMAAVLFDFIAAPLGPAGAHGKCHVIEG